MCRVWERIINLTIALTRYISELKYAPTDGSFPCFFGNGQNRRCLFPPDLRLFQPNTAQDEGISANIRTQHRRSAII